MFGRDKQQGKQRRGRQTATGLLVTAPTVRLVALAGPVEPDGDVRLALAGEVTLTYLHPDNTVVRETFGARHAKLAEITLPGPADPQLVAQLRSTCQDAPVVGVFADYRLSGGRPVELESFTMVGDGLYLDLGTRRAAHR